jgi:hypothetical protein
MRISPLIIFLASLCLTGPALACKVLDRYQEHLWGSTVGWQQHYRVVEIVEASDDDVVAMVRQNFANKTDLGKRVALRFLANEEAHAVCPISVEVGKTYLVRVINSAGSLLISRFNGYNIPSTHAKFGAYLEDLRRGDVHPMYVEANTVGFDSHNNRVTASGRVEIFFKDYILFADQVVGDRNELRAEGHVLFRTPEGSLTREDRMLLSDDFREAFRKALLAQRAGFR